MEAFQTQKNNMIGQLPPELQLRITNMLSYQDALMLQQVDKSLWKAIDPRSWPDQEKKAFVSTAQHWPKHNRCRIEHTTSGSILHYETNGFACYTCYRVLPMDAFARTQIRHGCAKGSPCDQGDRKCIECRHNDSEFTRGARITVVTKMWRDFPAGISMTRVPQFLCSTCNVFKPCGSAQHICKCDDCGNFTNFRRYKHSVLTDHLSSTAQSDIRFYKCPLCSQVTPTANEDIPSEDVRHSRCTFCAGDICRVCGCPADTSGNWWCGRICTNSAYALVRKINNREWPVRTRASDGVILRWKARNRARRTINDVLEQDVENVLELLALGDEA